jgi:eukaryotic-like serine/threonine-protein kinase
VIGIGATLNQRFVLNSELGRGGMGAVYRATDQILGRSVAIKVLKDHGGDEVARKIRLEAQILARLLHENVVRLYDFGEADGVYFLVMEEVDGSSFSRRWRAVPLCDRLRISAQVAEALDYAHHQGVIHRDVKPANVLLTAADVVKLSDFGLSMLAEAKDETGVIRGTPHYMSPEQARGRRLDHRTDLYSLGVMLYECVTGAVPFQGQSMAVIAQHVSEEPTPPRFKNPEIALTLETLILRLLAKDPEARPESGTVVAKALREESERERNRLATGSGANAVVPAEFAPTGAFSPSGAGGPSLSIGQSSVLQPLSSMSAPVSPSAPSLPSSVVHIASPLAREMLETVLATPIMLDADERYLCGHYLAFLLGGSRRQGFLLSRPMDPRNADRARLMLAMAWLMQVGPGPESANIKRAAELLETRPDIRPALNPVVILKYLATRDTPPKRKRFRAARKQLRELSPYAQKHMSTPSGVLNPGLIPQTLEDLRKIAPPRDEIDDPLVARWNRVTEVWRDNADFRQAVLTYATARAAKDPASVSLWPEVVYPLIERARWQRQFRPKHEALWDYMSSKILRLPDAGVRLDRIILQSVPAADAEELEEGLAAFADDPRIDDEDAPAAAPVSEDDRLSSKIDGKVSLRDLAADQRGEKGLVRLAPLDPYRFTRKDLRDLWNEAMAAMGRPGKTIEGARAVPVGPYRLAVIPSVRGRSAGQVALQGMRNKQIELLTPSIRAGGSSSTPVIAVWIYQDGSACIAYCDFKSEEKYILWHAPNAHQYAFDVASDLNHELYVLGMEVPDQLDRVLTKKFKPQGQNSA